MPGELSGFTVAMTADRRGEEQLLMLEGLGVDVVHAPAIRTLPVVGGPAVRQATEALIAVPPDVLVANTALGIRGWWGLASSWGLDGDLAAALAHCEVVCRGPKAAGAVATVGLDVAWRAPEERLSAVGDRLLADGVAGRRVAVQLDGSGSGALTDRLRHAGAEVVELPVYRWTLPDDCGPLHRLVDRCCAGTVDAVTFTAAPAIRNHMAVAAARGRQEALRRSLNTAVVACVGPVCAAAAREAGVVAPVQPPAWRLGSLVRLVGEELVRRRRTYRAGGSEVIVQGGLVVIDGVPVTLTERERAVLDAILRRDGALAARSAICRDVWPGTTADPHVLDTVIGRLRGKLGPAGASLATVVRRGYRWAAEPVDPPARPLRSDCAG